ncbi:MAG: ketoacyl-ACP synthase III [Gemmataceae bacterium]
MLPLTIAGLAHSLPEEVVANPTLEAELGLPAGWIEQRTGIRERRRATQASVLDLAEPAAKQALNRARCRGEDLRLILAASTGRHQFIPCTAALLQRRLQLPEGRAFAFDVDATCLSFLVGLQVAAQWLTTIPDGAALLFSSEKSRFSLNPREPESYVLIGDGAAAAVLQQQTGSGSGIHGAWFATYPSGADLTCFLGGGTNHHPNDPQTTAEMNLFHMNGPAVFKMALKLIPPFLDRVFTELGWQPHEVDAVVPHQASAPGVELLISRCGLHREQIVTNLTTRGNCIAASIPIALSEAVEVGRIRRGDRILLCGTGAGLSLGALALTY